MASSSISLMPFLRPLTLPRPATVRHFLRYSTTTRCRQTSEPATVTVFPLEDANLTASRYAPEAYPDPSIRSLPRPKESRASRRTAYPVKQRPYPTRRPSHHQPDLPKLIKEPVQALPESESAPNLPYFVSRSRFNSLPIYHLRKRGGNLKVTRIKNIDGDKLELRNALKQALGVTEGNIAVNSVTGHINIKGHFRTQIDRFLRERRF